MSARAEQPTLATALAGLLSAPLVVVDVGCRWGFADAWEALGDRVRIVGFDPDADECERLRTRYRDRPGVELVASALGARRGPATLYVTNDPAGTSTYHPALATVARHPGIAGGAPRATETVELTTLDDWASAAGIDSIDVIKLDTQGSELDILRGGARTLATARAIETEVQFNELYDDVPLFGDVDRFARDQGFVLWRLRSLAHYAQRGADTRVRRTELSYYDNYAAPYVSRAGQLFWGDAYFLRTELTQPDPARGWEALVRDACVAAALGFADMATLALDAADAVAPPHIASALEDARRLPRVAADGLDSSASMRAGELDRTTVPLDQELLVDLGGPIDGWGWHDAQRIGSRALRWTGPTREAAVDLGVRVPAGTCVEMLVVTAGRPSLLDELTLEVNRVPVPLSRTEHADGMLYFGTLPPDYAPWRSFTRLVLRTPDTVAWWELHPSEPADFEVGVAVEWIRLEPPAATRG